MPTKCKYCDEQVSLLKLLVTRLLTGSFTKCPNCGADDDTLEIAVDQNS